MLLTPAQKLLALIGAVAIAIGYLGLMFKGPDFLRYALALCLIGLACAVAVIVLGFREAGEGGRS